MKKSDYLNALYDLKISQKTKRFNCITTVKFFNDHWTHARKVDLNNYLHDATYSHKESNHLIIIFLVIYDIGDACEKVFLLKSGRVSVEIFIEIEQHNQYPIVNIINRLRFLECTRLGDQSC